MGINPLDSGSTAARPDRDVTRGHGTRALGPSDSSDSGSDTVGADNADAHLDSDSDRNGTGERATAGQDPVSPDGADIDTDRVEKRPGDDEPAEEK